MYDDLITRLRGVRRYTAGTVAAMMDEAADAIEELSRQLMELKMETCCCCEQTKMEGKDG